MTRIEPIGGSARCTSSSCSHRFECALWDAFFAAKLLPWLDCFYHAKKSLANASRFMPDRKGINDLQVPARPIWCGASTQQQAARSLTSTSACSRLGTNPERDGGRYYALIIRITVTRHVRTDGSQLWRSSQCAHRVECASYRD